MTHLSKLSRLSAIDPIFLVLMVLLLINSTQAQTRKPGDDEPVFQNYRGVQIGWLADDVRKKLGNPSDKGDEQDFYVFGDKETAQVLYDKATRKVIAISVDFMNGANDVITPQQVFGGEVEAKADGSKYKMVRYPKAGYWISYNRTAGNSPLVTVTIQKIATTH